MRCQYCSQLLQLLLEVEAVDCVEQSLDNYSCLANSSLHGSTDLQNRSWLRSPRTLSANAHHQVRCINLHCWCSELTFSVKLSLPWLALYCLRDLPVLKSRSCIAHLSSPMWPRGIQASSYPLVYSWETAGCHHPQLSFPSLPESQVCRPSFTKVAVTMMGFPANWFRDCSMHPSTDVSRSL